MKNILLFLSLVLIALSCSQNNVKIVKTNIPEDGEVASRQNLTITFDRELVTDSVVQAQDWDTTGYIIFKPGVEGVFKWVDKSTLLFSPAVGFKPNTNYTAMLTGKLFKFTKETLLLPQKSALEFHTELFNIKDALIMWHFADSTAIKPDLKVNLVLSQKINPAEMDSLLEVKIDGENKSFRIEEPTIGYDVTFLLERGEPGEFEGKNLSVKLKKGLTIIASDSRTKKEFEIGEQIPTLDWLKFTGIETGKSLSDLSIQLFTNQSIASGQDLKDYISVSPKIDFTVEQNEFGLAIRGNFNPADVYEVKISGKLKGANGRPMQDEYKGFATFDEIDPAIEFSTANAMYLSAKGSKNVGVRIYGIPKFTLTIVKIYENNILNFIRRGKRYRWHYEDGEQHSFYSYQTENLGDKIYEKKIAAKDLNKNGNVSLLNLDFEDVLKGMRGIYVVTIKSDDHFWMQDNRIISISDVGLIVKKSGKELLVYANSIKTSETLRGINVRLISTTNQLIDRKKTDQSGIAVFSDFTKNGTEFEPGLIAANQGEDMNYLVLNSDTEVDKSAFEGIEGIDGAGYKTFLYGDRNIYRPGDTLVIAGIVREEDWGVLREVPIKVELLMPNSKVYKEMKVQLNDQGGFSEKLYLPETLVTGFYKIRASLTNDVVLKTRAISIEEFMPDRIKVDVKTNKKEYIVPDRLVVEADVKNLYGPPAANRNYEMEFFIKTQPFKPKEFKDYTFDIRKNAKNRSSYIRDTNPLSGLQLDFKRRTGKTNSEGKLSESFELESKLKNRGLLRGTANLTVFDQSGRTVDRNALVDIYTQETFLGIGDFDYWVGTDKHLRIPLAAVDKNGKVVSGKARIQVIRYVWETILRKNRNGSYFYESQKIEKTAVDITKEISGKNFSYSFKPQLSGSYEIRVSIPDAETYVRRRFYAYSWGDTRSTAFEVDREGKISIETDKESYSIGDRAKLLFKTPFKGKMLITVERNSILDHYIVETDEKAASLNLYIKKEYLPNVFVSAALIKPLDNGAMPLTVAYGFAPVLVKDKKRELPVEIITKKESRSKRKHSVKVKTKAERDIHVTIAAVDEGILQVRNFQTPDPYGFFYQKIGLGVNSYSLYPYLFPELKVQPHRYGGGGEADKAYDLLKRTNPMRAKRVKLLAYWSGILKTNSRGEVSYDFDIPEFSGTVRIMACAYKDQAFGSAESKVVVSDPIVINAGLPRFLSPGDKPEMLITLSNSTENQTTTAVSVRTSGPVKVSKKPESRVTIPANSEKQLWCSLEAERNIGVSDITVAVEAFGEKFRNTTNISIRPAASLLKTSQSGSLAAGEKKEIKSKFDFIEHTVDSRLLVSNSPLVEYSEDLTYLIGYPHGCIEQTVSKAFPQLAYIDLIKYLKPDISGSYEQEAARNVRYAIDKIQSMQRYSGGLAFWQGGHRASWWGTAYAYHFLLEAELAGYSVSKQTMRKMAEFMIDKTSNADTTRYYVRDNGSWNFRHVYNRSAVYSLYVLALAGNPQVGLMNHFRSKPGMLSQDSQFMLAAAFKLAGDKGEYIKMLPAYQVKKSKKETGGSFSTPVRDLGISVYTLVTANPENDRISGLARHLSRLMKSKRYLSTQERSFGLMAMAKIAKSSDPNAARASIYLNEELAGKLRGAEYFTKDYKSQKTEIQNTGSAEVYYFWESEGLTLGDTYDEEDNFIKVRRLYYDRNGNELTGNKFRQGDLIVVKIELESLHRGKIENIVITDMLPAGFEIENPRIKNKREFKWIKKQDRPEHYDYRDDRINIFTDLNGSRNNDEKTFYYMVRAVTSGEFKQGPVSADAMYNGEYHSYNGGGTVIVEKR